jgi:hypothetical protein
MKERSIMIRNALITLGFAFGLALAAPLGQARAQSLTVPPDLRGPNQAAAPESPSRSAAKPKREKRAAKAKARSAAAPKLSTPQSGGVGKREYPADIDRSDDAGPSIRPSFNPSGRMGIGGRF